MGWRGGLNLLGIIGEPGHIADDHWTTAHEDCTGDNTTFLCKVKSHRGEPLNEAADDLTDLGRTIDPEHAVWTTRSNRMVFSWIDEQKKTRTSTWNQGVRNGV